VLPVENVVGLEVRDETVEDSSIIEGLEMDIVRAQLDNLLARVFVPGRLHPRIDAVAQVIRSPIAAESDFRLGKFEQAISGQRAERSSGGEAQGANRPAHQLKRFITARARSVREQLDGKSDGVILVRSAQK
jgi:hypothetical protein